MNELIKIEPRQINDHEIQTVNARELHAFLGVGKDFSNWIKDRIEQYEFIENQDFVVFAKIGENPKGGRPAKEYFITLSMAKELAMVERNEKGKQARRYFIECERRLKAKETKEKRPMEIPTFDQLTKNPPRLMREMYKTLELIGIDTNAAAISANQFVVKHTGINILRDCGQTHLLAKDQESLYYTPTQIGEYAGFDARFVNMLLNKIGFQKKIGGQWQPTKKAQSYFRIYDVGKRHSSGVPVTQIKWSKKVVKLIVDYWNAHYYD